MLIDTITQYSVLQPAYSELLELVFDMIEKEPDTAIRSAQYRLLSKINKEIISPKMAAIREEAFTVKP